MSLEVWPESELLLASNVFSIDSEFANVRSRMESGRVRQRPRFTQDVSLANIRFEYDKLQYETFRAFWAHRLNNGNDWFEMRLPVKGDESLTLVEVRFVSDYKADHRTHENWDISATIEFRAIPQMEEGGLDVLLIYGGDTQAFLNDVAALKLIWPVDWQYDP